MKLIDNYRENNALSAVIDLNKAKGLIGALESTRLDMEENRQRLTDYTIQAENALATHGDDASKSLGWWSNDCWSPRQLRYIKTAKSQAIFSLRELS